MRQRSFRAKENVKSGCSTSNDTKKLEDQQE